MSFIPYRQCTDPSGACFTAAACLHNCKDRVADPLEKTLRAYRILRVSIEAMMAPLGYHGSIAARDDRVQAVMDALAQIDAIENEGNPIRWSAILESLRDKDKGGPA